MACCLQLRPWPAPNSFALLPSQKGRLLSLPFVFARDSVLTCPLIFPACPLITPPPRPPRQGQIRGGGHLASRPRRRGLRPRRPQQRRARRLRGPRLARKLRPRAARPDGRGRGRRSGCGGGAGRTARRPSPLREWSRCVAAAAPRPVQAHPAPQHNPRPASLYWMALVRFGCWGVRCGSPEPTHPLLRRPSFCRQAPARRWPMRHPSPRPPSRPETCCAGRSPRPPRPPKGSPAARPRRGTRRALTTERRSPRRPRPARCPCCTGAGHDARVGEGFLAGGGDGWRAGWALAGSGACSLRASSHSKGRPTPGGALTWNPETKNKRAHTHKKVHGGPSRGAVPGRR